MSWLYFILLVLALLAVAVLVMRPDLLAQPHPDDGPLTEEQAQRRARHRSCQVAGVDVKAQSREPLRRKVQDWFLAVLIAVGIFVMAHWADIPLNP